MSATYLGCTWLDIGARHGAARRCAAWRRVARHGTTSWGAARDIGVSLYARAVSSVRGGLSAVASAACSAGSTVYSAVSGFLGLSSTSSRERTSPAAARRDVPALLGSAPLGDALHGTALHSAAPHGGTLHGATQHSAAPRTISPDAALHSEALQGAALHGAESQGMTSRSAAPPSAVVCGAVSLSDTQRGAALHAARRCPAWLCMALYHAAQHYIARCCLARHRMAPQYLARYRMARHRTE